MDPQIDSAGNRIHQVTELAPATLLEIAARLDLATSFADQIYRESEIDALWTLVDIRLREAGLAGDSRALERWQSLHSRLWVAHDLVPDGRCAEAAVILRELAAAL
jgi:hypothetical protein